MRNFFGAFADGAVLFPLLAALSSVPGYDFALLLATAGAAYLAAAFLFRVPMAVQPLKSIVVAGLALGASAAEIRLGGALVGIACLAILLADAERLAKRVPVSLVHGLQAGLGILLLSQALRLLPPPQAEPLRVLAVAAAVAAVVWISSNARIPLLGVVATAGLAYAVFFPAPEVAPSAAASSASATVRAGTLAALVLPQLALTLANSVIGTRSAARAYFGDRAGRVTIRRLLGSIGLGNILAAAVGGLPFCHGSGGVTAHARGGATHWVSNLIVGGALLVFAAIQARGGAVPTSFPPALMACLLAATGILHLGLARPTWASAEGKLKLGVMGLVAVITSDLLQVLAAGIVCEIVLGLAPRKEAA